MSEPGVYYFTGIDWDELAEADKDSYRMQIVFAGLQPICQCGNCHPHTSDCAVHGLTVEPCNCRERQGNEYPG